MTNYYFKDRLVYSVFICSRINKKLIDETSIEVLFTLHGMPVEPHWHYSVYRKPVASGELDEMERIADELASSREVRNHLRMI